MRPTRYRAVLPYKKAQMRHSYPLIRAAAGIVPTGVAVQNGNYEHVNPQNGKRVSIADILAFGTEYLQVDYIFWCTEEPYFSEQLVLFFQKKREQ